MRSSKSKRCTDNTMTNDYCSSFVIVFSVHFSDLLLLICHCIFCPSLGFTAPHLPLYCLSLSPIYCSSFVIVFSVLLSELLLLICYCIVSPSLRFTAPHLSLYCLSISLIYCSSLVIVLSVHLFDLLLLICHCMRSSKSERWTDNTMANEEQ
jgi:hypothetical protein